MGFTVDKILLFFLLHTIYLNKKVWEPTKKYLKCFAWMYVYIFQHHPDEADQNISYSPVFPNMVSSLPLPESRLSDWLQNGY